MKGRSYRFDEKCISCILVPIQSLIEVYTDTLGYLNLLVK
jgi:hypothetical protein